MINNIDDRLRIGITLFAIFCIGLFLSKHFFFLYLNAIIIFECFPGTCILYVCVLIGHASFLLHVFCPIPFHYIWIPLLFLSQFFYTAVSQFSCFTHRLHVLCFLGVGVAMVLVTVYVNLYYNILVAYILYYFFASMASEVPWANCENAWNTFRCVPISMYANKSYLHSYMHGKSSPHRHHRL